MHDLKTHPIMQSYIANNHFGKLIEMDFDLKDVGRIEYRMPIKELHLATPIAAHGGAISSLMDATMGVAALSNVIGEGRVVSTIEMKISFVSPARINDILIGTAETIKVGGKLIFIEGKIVNQNEELIAFGTGTFNAYPSEKAGF